MGSYAERTHLQGGKEHANADDLSRLPLAEAPAEVPQPVETVFPMDHLAASPSISLPHKVTK